MLSVQFCVLCDINRFQHPSAEFLHGSLLGLFSHGNTKTHWKPDLCDLWLGVSKWQVRCWEESPPHKLSQGRFYGPGVPQLLWHFHLKCLLSLLKFRDVGCSRITINCFFTGLWNSSSEYWWRSRSGYSHHRVQKVKASFVVEEKRSKMCFKELWNHKGTVSEGGHSVFTMCRVGGGVFWHRTEGLLWKELTFNYRGFIQKALAELQQPHRHYKRISTNSLPAEIFLFLLLLLWI